MSAQQLNLPLKVKWKNSAILLLSKDDDKFVTKDVDDDHRVLPPGWSRHFSNSQQRHYFCCRYHGTKHTQWHFPTASEAADPSKAKKRVEEFIQRQKRQKDKHGTTAKNDGDDDDDLSDGENKNADEGKDGLSDRKRPASTEAAELNTRNCHKRPRTEFPQDADDLEDGEISEDTNSPQEQGNHALSSMKLEAEAETTTVVLPDLPASSTLLLLVDPNSSDTTTKGMVAELEIKSSIKKSEHDSNSPIDEIEGDGNHQERLTLSQQPEQSRRRRRKSSRVKFDATIPDDNIVKLTSLSVNREKARLALHKNQNQLEFAMAELEQDPTIDKVIREKLRLRLEGDMTMMTTSALRAQATSNNRPLSENKTMEAAD